MNRFLTATIAGWVLAVTALAAPVERELGNGLVYLRVHKLPEDLTAKPAATRD